MKLVKLLKPVNEKEIMALEIDDLLKLRYKNTPLFEEVEGWLGKVYLNYFKKDGVRYIKIGKTKYVETIDRIIRNHQAYKKGWDDWVETSMWEYFDEVKSAKSVQNRAPIVEKCEKDILKAWNKWSSPADLPKINGMSEIFVYTKQLDAIARKYMEKIRYNG